MGFSIRAANDEKRFKRNLDIIVSEVAMHGALEHKPDEAKAISEQAKSKKNLAWQFILFVAIASVLYQIIVKT